jgi:REP element-mobilizing transposase RayT
MARPLRIQFPGAIYHVTFRGNERRDIFGDEKDRERFLAQLAESREWAGGRLYLVCLMSNHVHLLLETPRANLSAWMGRLLTAYAVYFNLRRRRSGHVTQGRYKAQLVEGDQYLLKLSRYIHLNPVHVKMFRDYSGAERVKALRTYRWSSYRGYAGLEKRWPFLDYEPILTQIAGTGKKRAAKYRAYVESGCIGHSGGGILSKTAGGILPDSCRLGTVPVGGPGSASRGTPVGNWNRSGGKSTSGPLEKVSGRRQGVDTPSG